MSQQFRTVKKKFTPIDRRIVIQILKSPQETAGGIILPDNNQLLPCLCVVVATGPKVEQVSVGDQVLVPKSVMTAHVRWDGDETVVVDEMGVWGILDEKIVV